MNEETLLSNALDGWSSCNRINETSYKLPMKSFINEILANRLSGNKYGTAITKKIVIDIPQLSEVSPKEDRGDARFYYGKGLSTRKGFVEIKSSIRTVNSSIFSLKNLRFYQPIDYYILCFIEPLRETMDGDFVVKNTYYLIKSEDLKNHFLFQNKFTYQNGTKGANENNDKVGMSISFKTSEIGWLFDIYNQLKGTSYNDLLEFFDNLWEIPDNDFKISEEHLKEIHKKLNSYTSRYKRHVHFVVDNKKFDKSVNSENVMDLIKYLGPANLILFSGWNSYLLGYGKTKWRDIWVTGEIYTNLAISHRDMTLCIKKLNSTNKFPFVKLQIY